MKPFQTPRALHDLENPSRNPTQLAVAALSLLLAGPVSAQTLRADGPAFVLSARPDLSTQDRTFTGADVLYMWVPNPGARSASLAPAPASEAVGWWLLASATQTFQGSLTPRAGGLWAELPLAEVAGQESAFTWTASIERGGVASLHSEALTIASTMTPTAPLADFAVLELAGEAPFLARFEDRSSGLVTSWSWDFGDGARSSEPAPTHLYRTPGSFPVSLTVAGPAGSDTRVSELPITVREQDLALAYGMNASENAWWQRGIAFADAMARSSEFAVVVNGTISRQMAPLHPYDPDTLASPGGWPDLSQLAPEERAGTRLFGSMAGSMPDGRVLPYVLTWDGTGACKLSGTPVVSEANRSANRVEVFVDPTVGNGDALLIWVLDWSDPADPVRNAHVWLPGMEAEKPILWPPFVEKLQAMNGGRGPVSWRAMDWNEVNQYGRQGGSAPFVFDLAGRITPASASQGTKRGVCPEFQVALCNAVGANLHFNVPHAANGIPDADYEAFLRDSFLRIRDGAPAVPGINGGRPFAPLAPHLKLTVEFSNETWNSGFPVNTWLKQRAQENGRTLHQQVAHEIRRVFRVAEEVFHGEHAARLRRYVGGWIGDPGYLLEVLSALGPGVQVDAAGPAAYFGPRKNDIDAWMVDAVPGGGCPNCPTPEGVIESARRRIQDLDLKLLEHQLITATFTNPDGSHPRLELYEAGASFVAGFQPWGPAANQAQRLPALYDAYVQDFVPALIARGVEGVLWYSFMANGETQGSGGPFGHWERMDQSITLPVPEVYVDEGAPKAAAIYRLPPRRTP